MLIALLTFVSALALVLGSYWALVVRIEDRAQRDLRQRLLAPNRVEPVSRGLVKDVRRLSSVLSLEHALSTIRGLVDPLQRTIEQSGFDTTVGVVVLASGCIGLLVFIVAEMTTRLWLVATPAALVGGLAPFLYLRRARHRRLQKVEELFPDALDLIARGLRAGHGLSVGLAMVGDEMPEPLAGEFRTLYERQSFGSSLPETLRAFAERIPLVDVRFFVTAVLTQRESGGNLSEVLDNLAAVVRERFTVKRQIRVLSAHGRLTGWVLAGLPIVIAVILTIVDPIHMSLFVHDPIGRAMLVGAVTLQLVGALIIWRIVKVEY